MKIKPRIVKNIFGLVMIIFSLSVFSGGFFNKLMEPGPYVQRYGRIYSIDPQLDGQTNSEAPRALLCNITTTIGVFLVAFSGKRRDPTQAYRILILGLALTGFGLIGSYYLVEMKRTAIPLSLP